MRDFPSYSPISAIAVLTFYFHLQFCCFSSIYIFGLCVLYKLIYKHLHYITSVPVFRRQWPLRTNRGRSGKSLHNGVASCDTLYTAHAHVVLPFSSAAESDPGLWLRAPCKGDRKTAKWLVNSPICGFTRPSDRHVVLHGVRGEKHATVRMMNLDSVVLTLTGSLQTWPKICPT